MNHLIRRFVFLALVVLFSSLGHARDIYVALDGTGSISTDGTDWDTAFTNIHYALNNIATPYDTVYIKGGTWALTNQLPLQRSDITITGGYEGEGAPGSNNPLIWPTTLTIAHNQEGTVTNRVMIITTTNSTIKNLTFCGGIATDSTILHPLPGEAASFGGGIYILDSSALTLQNCAIVSNYATEKGGGIFVNANSTDITITNCVIGANALTDSDSVQGAGLYQAGASLLLINTLLWGNQAPNADNPQGLALHQNKGSAMLANCTVAKHMFEGGIRTEITDCAIIISNSILWDSSTPVTIDVPITNIFYSIVRNGAGIYTNIGCFYDDPLFANEAENDFHIQSMQGHWTKDSWLEDYANSPALDAGSPDALFENEPMPNGGRLNLGAYGNTEQASRTLSPPMLVVSSRSISTNHALTNYTMLGQSAPDQPFYIWSTNAYGRATLFSVQSDSDWLVPVPASGEHNLPDDPTVLQATFPTEALPLGTHTSVVTVVGFDNRGNECGNSPVQLHSVVHVLPSPTLAVHPSILRRSVVSGSNAPSQTFEVWNSTDTRFGLQYTTTVSEIWLSVSPPTGTSYGEHNPLTLNYNVGGLGPGTHSATVTVHGTAAEYPLAAVPNSPQEIQVLLTVTRAPGLAVEPRTLNNSATVGFMAPMQTIDVSNNSMEPRGPMNYAVWSDKPWIKPEPSSGGSTGEHDTIDLWFNTTNLVSGIYTAQLTVAAGHWSGSTFVPSYNATNSPIVIPTILTINAKPEISVNPRGLTNYITSGGNAPVQTIKLWNGADHPKGPMNFIISSDKQWLSPTPTSGAVTGDTATITLNYQTSGLTNGTYHGILTVRGYDPTTGEDLGSLQVDVGLMVRPMPILSCNPSQITQTILQNTIAPSRSLNLWNGSAAPRTMMNYIMTCDQPWLSVNPASGFSSGDPNTSTITFNTAGLAYGLHSGNITVIAWDEITGQIAENAPRNIPITMQVAPRMPANSETPIITGLPYIGSRLTAHPGIWTPPATVTFTTQWQRADSASGLNLKDIPGATHTNYVVQTSDAGKYIRSKIFAIENSVAPPLTNIAYSVFSDASKIRAAKFDFDADGKADPWFYEPPTGLWRFKSSAGLNITLPPFGWSEAAAMPGDYDGDGLTDLAVYYQAGGLWYIFTARGEFRVESFGWWEALPVPADYDGDGATDIAVYYPPTGTWYILTASRKFIEANFGFSGAIPVPGDYDGDRTADLAVYHQAAGNWYIITLDGRLLAWAYNFGWSGALPVPGDFTGDGAYNLAVYDPAANYWYFLINNQLVIASFGTANGNGVPLPADYDGDSICDPATVHINGNFLVWCMYLTSKGYSGVSYDAVTGRWR